MDDRIFLSKISELHKAWWEAVWNELAWDEHGHEPADFALTIQAGWDKFHVAARILGDAGVDTKALVTEFEASGDPKGVIPADYAAMLGRTRCAC